MKKRFLSLILVLVMCLNFVPMAQAAEESNGFIIESGSAIGPTYKADDRVLVEYDGPGGDVVIPDGVTAIASDAFGGRSMLKSVVIPNSVTVIEKHAFSGCSTLKSVVIPDSVTTIEENTFHGCSSLKSVVIPDSVTAIGSWAFSRCSALENISISNSVTTIGANAFYGCSSLKSVVIPNSVTAIGSAAFYRCSALENAVIPNTVTSIEPWAFCECVSLKSVVIPDSVTAIKEYTFNGCTSLERAVIGDGVTTIDRSAFEGCTKLKDLTIGKNVEYIGRVAFGNCTSLTDINIPDSVAYIDWNAFTGCPGFAQAVIPDTAAVLNDKYYFDIDNPKVQLVGYAAHQSTYIQEDEEILSYNFEFYFMSENGVLSSLGTGFDAPDWDEWKNNTLDDYFFYWAANTGKYGQIKFSQLWDEASSEFTIPDGVRVVQSPCALPGVESVTIPASVIQIDLVSMCDSLKRVVFPSADKAAKSLKYMDLGEIFHGCTNLEEIVNCPSPLTSNAISANQKIRLAWSGVNPKTCITQQSERITALSNQICAGYATDYERAEAIYNWMTDNIVYDYDYFEGRKNTVTIYPEEVIDSKLTVCDGYSRLTQALLQAQGIPAVYVLGAANGAGGWPIGETANHGWNMAYVDGRWIYLDTTWGATEKASAGPLCAASLPSWFDPTETCFSLMHWGYTSHLDPALPHYVGDNDTPVNFAANPTRSTVLVNGEKVAFDAYTINDNNYFKLRDLAKVLSGTEKQFEVTWDGTRKAIDMTSGKPYTPVGQELIAGDGTKKTAKLNTSTIYLDGQPIYLTAYTINDNNYFKLRDVGTVFDFDVTWDGKSNTIIIDTSQSYTPD